MTQEHKDHVKILFRFFSDVLDEETVETMWAKTISAAKGLYQIDNIPFYVSCATDDIVFAEYDETEQMLTYRKTVIDSGNSTVQVIIMDENTDIHTIRERFKELGCESEQLRDRYFVMEVLAKTDYKLVKAELDNLFDQDILDYAEPALGVNHQF